MTQSMVISLEMMEFLTEMGDRGSKIVILYIITVKEQRVDGFLEKLDSIRYTLVVGKSGSKVKHSYRIL